MRILFFLILITIPLSAASLTNGKYSVVRSNSESVCPQKIKFEKGEDYAFLRVAYVGDCIFQGPYIYYCQGDLCTDGIVEYKITSSGSFLWENKNYQSWAEFKLEGK